MSDSVAGRRMFGWAQILDLIANPDRAAVYDVRVQPAAVDEAAQHTRLSEFLEVAAGVAELGHDRLDLADADAVAQEIVQRDPARHHVAADLAGLQLDAGVRLQILDRLGLEQRDVLVAVAVAVDPGAGPDLDSVGGFERPL